MDGSNDDWETNDGDKSEDELDEKKAGNRENDEIPTDEDDDIDSDALGSDEPKFAWFKFLSNPTTKEGVNATCGPNVVDDSSTDGECGTDLDDGVILNEEKDSDKDVSPIEDEVGEDDGEESSKEGAQDKEANHRTEFRRSVVANISKAVKVDAEKGTAVEQQQNTLTDLLCGLCLLSTPKQKRHDTDASTPSLWVKMQTFEEQVHPNRLSTLDKQSTKNSTSSTVMFMHKLNSSATWPHNNQ
ncbi:hypothetical protein HOY80DRAFT_1084304 [Tuber brumale]|nr:hypothetical protein HOY80DRAFT_1084304 [Tuber brumale]